MNYRHSFHAGNSADVVKHSLLIALVRALQHKQGALTLIDTHAGCGLYDLGGRDRLAVLQSQQAADAFDGGVCVLLGQGDTAMIKIVHHRLVLLLQFGRNLVNARCLIGRIRWCLDQVLEFLPGCRGVRGRATQHVAVRQGSLVGLSFSEEPVRLGKPL